MGNGQNKDKRADQQQKKVCLKQKGMLKFRGMNFLLQAIRIIKNKGTCRSVVRRRHNAGGRDKYDKLDGSLILVSFQSCNFFLAENTHPAMNDSTSSKLRDKTDALAKNYYKCSKS